jgi:hypothetical protein
MYMFCSTSIRREVGLYSCTCPVVLVLDVRLVYTHVHQHKCTKFFNPVSVGYFTLDPD